MNCLGSRRAVLADPCQPAAEAHHCHISLARAAQRGPGAGAHVGAHSQRHACTRRPIDALLALERRLGANATPTWFLPDGERYVGAMRMEDVIPLLNAASPADASPKASAESVRAP